MALERFDPAADETVTLKADRSSSSPLATAGGPVLEGCWTASASLANQEEAERNCRPFGDGTKLVCAGKERRGKVPAEMPANSVVKGLNRVRKSEAGRGLTVNVNPLLSTSQR
jgi:hypothetical protein